MQRKSLYTCLAATVSFLLIAELASAANGFPQPTICARSCWSARSPSSSISQMSGLTRAIIHHTAGAGDYNTTSQSQSAALVRAIQNYHMDSNGWSDIGYHFVVDKLGNRFEGRQGSISSRPRGAHDAINDNSMGFNLMGYFHSPHNQAPTTAQRNAVYDLIAWKLPTGYSPYGSGSYGGNTEPFLGGHRDVGLTACPGDLMYAYIGTNYSGGEARNAVNSRINPAPSTEVIVDNTSAGFSTSANWWTTTATPGFYGTNYHTRGAEAISDPASWSVTLPTTGSYKVYAQWAAGSNRSTTAGYIITHSGGSVTVPTNQTINGGAWRELGTYNFNAGTDVRVQLSCWTTAGTYVVADGIRFVKQ